MALSVKKEGFGEATLYTVSNGKVTFCATDLGCTFVKILVPSKSGQVVDVLLGHDDCDGYKTGGGEIGAIVGRVANRIAGAQFTLDGKTYKLEQNDGTNCLHGGKLRYSKIIWDAKVIEGESAGVEFTRDSPDGEQGFPGNAKLTVRYTLDESNKITLEYVATTDASTPINLTNHAYFNLNGEGDVLGHVLTLNCDEVLALDKNFCPTGEVIPVEGTPFDFQNPRTLGEDVDKLTDTKGYDHCYLTGADEGDLDTVGCVVGDKSGIRMDIYTNQRGVQLYTGNYLNGKGKGGTELKPRTGVCFETQRAPNAVNVPSFPSCILRPGETYSMKTVWAFS